MGSGVWGGEADRRGTFGVAGLGERRRLAGAAGITTRRQVTLLNICSLGTGRTPSPLDPHYFPVTLFIHQNAGRGIVAVLARV
jgi:hypothetical protein